MSRPLSEPLYNRLRRAHPPDRAYAQSDWDEEAMPGPVQHFLEHLLHHHSRREARRLRRARTEWIDYDHPEVEAAVRTFFEAVEAHAQVPAGAWADTLQQAVSRTTDYLVRPVPVLVDFVFDDTDEALPVASVRWRMQFFQPYGYLREAVRAYVEKQEVDVLAPGPFESVLARVDRHIPADFDADRWLRVLDPLFETAQCALGRKRVPVALLQTFFEAKGQSGVVERLATYGQEDDEMGPTALRRLLAAEDVPSMDPEGDRPERARDGVPSASSSDASSPPQRTPLWQRFQGGAPADESSQRGGEDRSRQPLWTQFHRDRSTRAAAITENDEAVPRGAPDANGAWTEPSAPASSGSASSPDGEDTDLAALERDVLGTGRPSHRSVYVNELFGGDRAAYRQVLQRLRTAGSWSEASQIIARDVFREHGVNIYSDPAVHFTDAVEARIRE